VSRSVVDFLNDLEAKLAVEEMASATGLLLEVIAGDYRIVHGPFSKDGVAVFEAIERLISEEDPEAVPPNEYNVLLLQPVSQTLLPHPDHGRIDGEPRANGGDDPCVCGGTRYFHALAPHGCDDCDCEAFRAV